MREIRYPGWVHDSKRTGCKIYGWIKETGGTADSKNLWMERGLDSNGRHFLFSNHISLFSPFSVDLLP